MSFQQIYFVSYVWNQLLNLYQLIGGNEPKRLVRIPSNIKIFCLKNDKSDYQYITYLLNWPWMNWTPWSDSFATHQFYGVWLFDLSFRLQSVQNMVTTWFLYRGRFIQKFAILTYRCLSQYSNFFIWQIQLTSTIYIQLIIYE